MIQQDRFATKTKACGTIPLCFKTVISVQKMFKIFGCMFRGNFKVSCYGFYVYLGVHFWGVLRGTVEAEAFFETVP